MLSILALGYSVLAPGININTDILTELLKRLLALIWNHCLLRCWPRTFGISIGSEFSFLAPEIPIIYAIPIALQKLIFAFEFSVLVPGTVRFK
jgi:hypothetical protein